MLKRGKNMNCNSGVIKNYSKPYELFLPATPAWVKWPKQELGRRGELGNSASALLMKQEEQDR